MRPVTLEISVGAVVADRYIVEGLLGEGGMGSVWAARHMTTRKRVALKVLKPAGNADARMRARFLREARAACAVQHPSIIQVHDVIEVDENPAIVMELLEGETFAAKLHRERPMGLAELASVMLPVCSALGKAHELGIVHRDLKPENIFLAYGGEGGPQVKVLDFGIAKLTASDGDAARSAMAATGTGMMLGTPFYMSPEQMFGERDVDHRSDIWAIGIILYEALAGVRPTEGENIGQILKIVTTDFIVPMTNVIKTLPPQVTDLVARMLKRDRRERPADLQEVCDTLRMYSEQPFVSFGPAAPHVPTPALSTPSPMHQDFEYAATAMGDSASIALSMTHPSAKKRLRRAYVGGLLGAGGLVALAAWRILLPHTSTPAAAAVPSAPQASASTTSNPTATAPSVSAGAVGAEPAVPATGSAAVTPPPSAPLPGLRVRHGAGATPSARPPSANPAPSARGGLSNDVPF